MKKKKICMLVQNPMVKGGIAAVVNGYRGSKLENDFDIIYVESYQDGGKFTKILKGVRGYFHFAKVLLIDKPDIVHIHSSFGASFYRKLPFIYMTSFVKKPIINHIHGAEFGPFYLNTSDRKKRLIQKVYNKCTILIALSEEWKERLKLIVPEDRIAVIENYSIIHYDAFEEKCNRKSNDKILFLGEIGKRKGCYDIPDVVKKVVHEVPNAKFVIGGSGDIERVKRLLQEKQVDKNVVFLGWIRGEQKDKQLRSSDIFFLPSYNEGMPMAILDAMGYGLPVVSTNVGGIPKIVRIGENGFVCEPGDTDSLAKAIIEMLNDIDLLKKYSCGSYKIVKEKYSLEFHVNLIERLYNKL